MKILVPVVLALLSAPASAENRPFNTSNGRTTRSTPAAAAPAPAAASGGAAANGAAEPDVVPLRAGVTVYGPGSRVRTTSGRGFRATGSRTDGRAFGIVGSRRATGSGAGQGASGVGSRSVAEEEAPPNFNKPGALIRDTGQQPKYEQAATRTHTADAGEIVMSSKKAFHVGTAPSVHIGPKDTLPPPNPGNTGSYYNNRGGAAPNGAAPNGSSGSGAGHDNNGSGNNGKDKPGDDDDGKGGDKAKESSFYDAF